MSGLGSSDAAAVQAGNPGLTPHELRHTAASLAIKAGPMTRSSSWGQSGSAADSRASRQLPRQRSRLRLPTSAKNLIRER
jgi:integrase